MNYIKQAFTPMRQMVAATAIFALVLSLSYGVFAPQSAFAGDGDKVTICHWDEGHGGRYQSLPANKTGDVQGHAGLEHQNGKDIIPEFDYSDGHFGGQNLDLDLGGYTGEDLLANDCNAGGTITVNKIITGTTTIEANDFKLKVDNENVTNGGPETFDVGTYTVTEEPKDDTPTDYIATFGGACDSNGQITIALGEDKVCTITNDYTQPAPLVNFCDPSQRPDGMSIAEWLADNQVDGSACFDYEVTTPQCGALDVQFTENKTPYNYSFYYVVGTATPILANWAGDGQLPVQFTEDEYGGSVDVTYYVTGPESDYFTGFGIPNIWDDNGTTVQVDTDCTSGPTGSIEITKYECPADTIVTRTENGVDGDVPELCTKQSGAYFGYVYGEQDDAGGPYPELGETPTPADITNGSGVLTISDLPATGRYLIVETDDSNNKLAHDAILGLYCEGDGDTSGTNDNQELTFVTDGGTAHCVAYNKQTDKPQLCTVTIVSDADTTVVEKSGAFAKILSTIDARWTALIAGADWIWGDDPVAAPVDGVSQTFERKFGWNGPVTNAKLTIAADNTFDANLNGSDAGSDLTEFNYQAPAKEYDVTSLINQGNNDLSVGVYNMPLVGDPENPVTNPAGLLYKLEVTGTDAGCDIPYVEDPKQCIVASDETTMIGDTPASLTWTHNAWASTTEFVSGEASWIWDATVDPLNGEVLTFTKTFNVDTAPTSATLKVAADNGYTVTLNGDPLSCDGSGSSNFSSIDSCSAPVVSGVNTLVFTATNDPYNTTDPHTNPSGLIYELTIDGSSCSPVPPEVVLGCTDSEALNYNQDATPGNADAEDCEYTSPVCEIGDNLLLNGSFETPVVDGSWNIFSSVANWVISLSDGLELWHNFNGSGAGLASDGVQNAELDGNSPTMITQTVSTTPGATYQLRFDFSPRAGRDLADNSIDALVDGSQLMNVSADGTSNSGNVWTTHSQTFVASTTSTNISFKDIGTANSYGSLMDNAVLCKVADPGPVCTDEPNGGWADSVATSTQGLKKDGSVITDSTRTDPTKVLDESDWTVGGSTGFYSLGFGGSVTVSFDNYVPDVVGNDISIHEATNGTYPLETALIEVSQNGTTWYSVGTADNTAGDRVSNFDFSGTGLTWIKYVRITDTTNPALHISSADGFDLDAVDATETVCAQPNDPEPKTATVTMCKVDADDEPLTNWTLMLRGEKIEDIQVPSTLSSGVNSTNSLSSSTSYLAEVNGIWNNQGGANPVDAEYSTTDGWSTHMDGYTSYGTDILELQINSSFDPNSNWGAYNSAHTYAQSFIPSSDGVANFRIFDGSGTTQNEAWFGDNSGSLDVTLSKGYAGITGNNGCVTFTDVPYGTYTADEVMQDGWNNVSGLGGVVINDETESFNIMNEPKGTEQRYTLDITTTGDGEGRVESDDDGIICYSEGQEGNDCSETYPAGTVVSLTVTPNVGSNFNSGWTVGTTTCTGTTSPCTVTMNSDISMTAHFDLNRSFSSTGGGGGRIVKLADPEPDTFGAGGDLPLGEVLGASTFPVGAPNTGAGGTSPDTTIPTFVALLGMLMAFMTIRATRNV